MRFIERNTRTTYRIEGLRREDVPEYPMKALREAITNAVMHRDWFFDGTDVFVEIYADRIEVVSPGGLPRGLTLAELGHKSVRRNALIANLLHRMGLIYLTTQSAYLVHGSLRIPMDRLSPCRCPCPAGRNGHGTEIPPAPKC